MYLTSMITTNTTLPAKKGRPRNTKLDSLRSIVHDAVEFLIRQNPWLPRITAFGDVIERIKKQGEAVPFKPGQSLSAMYRTYRVWRHRKMSTISIE